MVRLTRGENPVIQDVQGIEKISEKILSFYEGNENMIFRVRRGEISSVLRR